MNKYRQQEVAGTRTYCDSQVYRLISPSAAPRTPAPPTPADQSQGASRQRLSDAGACMPQSSGRGKNDLCVLISTIKTLIQQSVAYWAPLGIII